MATIKKLAYNADGDIEAKVSDAPGLAKGQHVMMTIGPMRLTVKEIKDAGKPNETAVLKGTGDGEATVE